MNEGAVFATFIVVFREALEASLIIGILLTVLAHLGGRRYFSHIFFSTIAAILLSVAAGSWLVSLTDSAQERTQKILEGAISLIAAGVLTYMFFWMESQSRKIKSELQLKIETALSAKDDWAMISLAFFAVLREGAETVLFLKAVALQSGGSVSWAGGLAGCAVAVGLVALLFVGGKKIPLKPLFRWTGILILFMAAGLLAYGIHELEEARLIAPVIYPLYDINGFLSDKEGLGSFLKAIFGYNGNPSLVETIAYWGYMGTIGVVIALKKENRHV